MNVSHLLTQTITVANRTSTRTSCGDPTFDTATTLKARVERKVSLVRGPDGNEFSTSHVIVTTTEIEDGTKIWLPGADTTDNNAALVPLARGSAVTTGGQTLYETYV